MLNAKLTKMGLVITRFIPTKEDPTHESESRAGDDSKCLESSTPALLINERRLNNGKFN